LFPSAFTAEDLFRGRGYNAPYFRSLLGNRLREEATIRDRYLADGVLWDLHIYSLTANDLRSWAMFPALMEGRQPERDRGLIAD